MKSMLSLLLAAMPLTLFAQPVVSPAEIVSPTFVRADPASDRIAFAGDLIAWADRDHVRVENIVTRETFDIPRVDDAELAPMLPALAKRGDGYLLAWADVVPSSSFPFPNVHALAALRLDASGRPLSSTPARGAAMSQNIGLAFDIVAIAMADGFRVYVSESGAVIETRVDANGTFVDSRRIATRNFDGVAAVAATPRALVFTSAVMQSGLTISPPPPSDFHVYTRPVAANDATTIDSYSETFRPPAHVRTSVATNGSGFLALWRGANHVRALLLDADGRALGSAFDVAAASSTENTALLHVAVVWNGTHYVAAWDDHGDIFGATIADDGSVLSRFPIAADSEDERMPALASRGDGRTVVAYQVRDGNSARIATRTITSASRRVRAARPQ
jgi:hypothetical protein